MAKKLDPQLIEILSKYGEDVKEALWDCHGVWVAYHKAIERIAAKAGVVFDMPQVIEANSASKTATIAVRGVMGDRTEWSFGEASPSNNKNAYPFAMAEKRAKDRVVLKLVGLHGHIYSEEESDDFKPRAQTADDWPGPIQRIAQEFPDKPVKTEPPRKANGLPAVGYREDGTRTSFALKKEQPTLLPELDREADECKTLVSLSKLRDAYRKKAADEKWNGQFMATAKEIFLRREAAIHEEVERLEALEPEELAELPVKTALEHSLANHPLNAG